MWHAEIGRQGLLPLLQWLSVRHLLSQKLALCFTFDSSDLEVMVGLKRQNKVRVQWHL